MNKDLEEYDYSKEYEDCLNKANKLNLYEQFSLANELLANFQEYINNKKKE